MFLDNDIYNDAKEKGNVIIKIDITKINIGTTTPKSGGLGPCLYI